MPPVMGMALLLSNGLVQVRLAFFFVFFFVSCLNQKSCYLFNDTLSIYFVCGLTKLLLMRYKFFIIPMFTSTQTNLEL